MVDLDNSFGEGEGNLDHGNFEIRGAHVKCGVRPEDGVVTRMVKLRWFSYIRQHGSVYAFKLMKDFEEDEVYFKCRYLREVLIAGDLWEKYKAWRMENPTL